MVHLGQWDLDHVTEELQWSEGIPEIFGIQPEEFEGTYDAFLSMVHPEDRDYENKMYSESVRDKIPHDIVHRILLNDGTIKHVHKKCITTYDQDGKPLLSRGTLQDISWQIQLEEDLRESHRYISSILEGMGEGLMVVTPNYEITDCNSSFLNQYDLPREEIIGSK